MSLNDILRQIAENERETERLRAARPELPFWYASYVEISRGPLFRAAVANRPEPLGVGVVLGYEGLEAILTVEQMTAMCRWWLELNDYTVSSQPVAIPLAGGIAEGSTTLCTDCWFSVPDGDLQPASLGDDATWERLAKSHGPGCEWIATRGGQRPPAAPLTL